MKTFNLLRKPETWFFLSIILAATIIIMAVVWSHHECLKPEPVDKYQKEIEKLNDKIKDYEIKKIQNTIDIVNMSASERDSLRAAINPK